MVKVMKPLQERAAHERAPVRTNLPKGRGNRPGLGSSAQNERTRSPAKENRIRNWGKQQRALETSEEFKRRRLQKPRGKGMHYGQLATFAPAR